MKSWGVRLTISGLCRGALHRERQSDAATVAASRASERQGVHMSVLRTGGIAVVVLAVVSGCSWQSAGGPVGGAGESPPPASVAGTAATPSPSASPIPPTTNPGGSSGSARATPPGQVPAPPPVGTVEKLIIPRVQKPSRPGPPAMTPAPPKQTPPPPRPTMTQPPNQNPPPPKQTPRPPPPEKFPPPPVFRPPPSEPSDR